MHHLITIHDAGINADDSNDQDRRLPGCVDLYGFDLSRGNYSKSNGSIFICARLSWMSPSRHTSRNALERRA